MLNELYEILNPGIQLFGYLSFRAVMAFIFALLISFLIGPKIIRTLKNRQIGEMIRKNGPESHQKKRRYTHNGGDDYITISHPPYYPFRRYLQLLHSDSFDIDINYGDCRLI